MKFSDPRCLPAVVPCIELDGLMHGMPVLGCLNAKRMHFRMLIFFWGQNSRCLRDNSSWEKVWHVAAMRPLACAYFCQLFPGKVPELL